MNDLWKSSMRNWITISEDYTSSFKKRMNLLSWFGNSKVVDRDGNPLVLYHGTGADVREFKTPVIWGAVSPQLASEYASMRATMGGNPNIIPIIMRILKPFDADPLPNTVTVKSFFEEVIRQGNTAPLAVMETIKEKIKAIMLAAREEESGPHYDKHDFWFESSTYFGKNGERDIRDIFIILGFDGIKMTEHMTTTYGAFSSSQVKSVFNKGSFDASSPFIDEAINI